MSTPVPTLDLFAGMAAKDAGMALAAQCRNELVNRIREHVTAVAKTRPNRLVTADDFDGFLRTIGKSHRDLGNAAGSVFQHPSFEFSGIWTPSKRKSSKARPIRVWRLK